MKLKVGETIKNGKDTYEITKQIDDFTYEIINVKTGVLSVYAIGRPIVDENIIAT